MGFKIKNGVLVKYTEEDSVTDVVIPEGVTVIGKRAFKGCGSLTSITITDSVTEIGEYAFLGCTSLTSVTIPDSVTEISYYAFFSCTNLKSVTIPNSVTEIGCNAFEGTPWFENLCKNSNDGFVIVDHILVKYMKFNNVTDVVIPEGVTKIERVTFSGCTSLTSVTIPDSVTEIGSSAFSGCTSLTSVTIPNSVTTIRGCAFESTPWIENLCKNNDGFAIVNHILLEYKGNKTDVIIPDGVTRIGSFAFCKCTNLISITIPDGVTKIGKSAFWDCRSLTSVTIPDSVTTIGDGAFYFCLSLEKIVTPDFDIKVNCCVDMIEQVRRVALRDFSVEVPYETKCYIILQMFLQKPDDEEFLTYVKKNFSKMVRFAIDNNDVETISAVCKRKDLLTKRNIDNLIEYAIQHTQNGGTVEIQALLMRYKNENIGYSERRFSI